MAQPKVIVIGGGLAGGAAATLLARAGFKVTLFEKETGPQHKICGEFISIEAQAYLARLGLDQAALAEAGAVPIDRLLLGCKNRRAEVTLPFTALSLSRRTLDAAVLTQARAAGANIHYGEAVKTLAPTDAGWLVTTPAGSHAAPIVLLATGKYDLRGWPRKDTQETVQDDLIGLKMYYRLTVSAAALLNRQVQLHLFSGGYAGLEPVEDDLANLCLVVRKSVFARHGKEWTRLLHALCADNPWLAQLLREAAPQWEKPLAIFGIPYGFIADPTHSAPGLYRLGDQLAVIPSLCGDGIAIALHSAFAVADSLRRGEVSHDYHARLQRQLRPQIGHALRLSRWIVRPQVQWLLPWLAQLSPQLVCRFIRATRVTG